MLHTTAEPGEADDAVSMLEDTDVDLMSGIDCKDFGGLGMILPIAWSALAPPG